MSWLGWWLRSRRLSPGATCASPAALHDANIHHLDQTDFKCTQNAHHKNNQHYNAQHDNAQHDIARASRPEWNPLACTCHMSWLGWWLRSRRLSPGATCASPAALHDANIHHLDQTDFKCTPEDKGCLSADYCPSQCSCTGTVVRCSRAQLTALPDNIPRQTTELLSVCDLNQQYKGCLSADYCPSQCSCTGTVVRCSRAQLTALPDNIPRQTTELLSACDLNEQYKGCLSADYCPSQCSCTGTVVRCSRAQLTALPDNIPRQTTELPLNCEYYTYIYHACIPCGVDRAQLTALPDNIPRQTTELIAIVTDRLSACRLNEQYKGCLSADYCPSQCSCTGTVVRCSRAQLTALPDNIPRQTTEL
ncbi:hypothetical protein NE865_12654 [Phthorimaea operculella]|nr:hypothetical protein NE865_12654 [Phthorimaea operculella]